MIDLTQQLTQAQIAFFLGVIAVAVVWYVFGKKPTKRSKNS